MQSNFPQKRLGLLLASLFCTLPVQAAVTLLAIMYIGVNLTVDLTYAWLDPRISYR